MTIKFNAGVDIGYNEVKAVSKSKRVKFPSVTGSPEQAVFSFNSDVGLVLVHPYSMSVGAQAIEQSLSLDARIDRGWIAGDKWHALALTALSELTKSSSGDVVVVCGLPTAFYSDLETVKERLLGKQSFQRLGRGRQTLTVTDVRCMPQPFGSLFCECLSDSGKVKDQALRSGRVGVLDIGGKTTNLLTSHGLKEISKESTSIDAGGWSVVGRVQDWLKVEYPDLSISEYDLVPHIISREISYHGDPVDLGEIVDHAVDNLVMEVVGASKRLWNGAAHLDAILLTGGGAHLCGKALLSEFKQARIVQEPVFSNSIGFWRFAQAVSK